MRVREDALPENYDYRDTGCRVAPRCLACPLARCVLDEKRDIQAARARVAVVAELRARGVTRARIAELVGVSEATVARALRRAG